MLLTISPYSFSHCLPESYAEHVSLVRLLSIEYVIVAQFEQIVAKQKQVKMGSVPPKEEVQDTSIKILQLR